MRVLCLSTFLIITTVSLSSQCTIACSNALQMSLNQDGYFVVTPGMLLQGNIANCPNLGVQLFDENQNFIGDTLTCLEAGTIVTGRLINYDNNVFCDTDLSVFDNTAPIIDCPEIFINCNAPLSPDSIGYPTATDNCTAFTQGDLSFSDNMVNLDCYTTHNGNSVTARLERTWLVVDENGNEGSCIQNIYLLTATLNSVMFPANLSGSTSLTCSLDDPFDLEVAGEPLIGARKINANGYCDISIIYDDQVFNTCGGATTIIRKWLALDVCSNNTRSYDQVIEVQDKIGPAIICPDDITVDAASFSCDATVEIPVALVSDECSDFTVTPSWEFGNGYGSYENVPVGVHQLTYSASDACGNSSICNIMVSVIDNTPPTPVCENGINISLLPMGVARVFVNTFDEGTFDNCGIDRFEVSRDGQTFGPFVDFFCDDVTDSPVSVQFRAYDLNGLFNECWVSVSVYDNFGPDITCPSDVTVDCLDDINNLNITGQPTVSDACGMDTTYFLDSSNLTCGVGEVQRLWKSVDVNGNATTCTQVISVVDNSILDIAFPADVVIELCTSSIDTIDTGSPVITNQGCKNILTNSEDQYFTSSSSCYSIFRTWTVIDWCSYDPNSGSSEGEYTHVQRIDVEDNTSPVITCPADTLIFSFSINCEAVFVNISIPTATDCSGNTFIKNNSVYADNADEDASGFYPNGIHQITYTAYDNCGNSSLCVQQIEIKDKKGPSLSCNSGLVIEMNSSGSVTIDPSLLIANVSDNCTPTEDLVYQLLPNTFNCDDIGMQNVTLFVADAEGNITSCNAMIDIQDNMFSCSPAEVSISGQLKNLAGDPVEGMEIVANGFYFTYTDGDGNYAFNGLPAGANYTLTVTDEVVERNGISTFDMVLGVGHILQTRVLDNPYRMIALDTDNDNKISVFDILEMRQLILEYVNKFSSDVAWKCVDASFVFEDETDPFLDDYPLFIQYDLLINDINSADFVAIKLGDVNGDGANLNGGTVEVRSSSKMFLELDEEQIKSGELKEIAINMNDKIDCTGMQFEIVLDTNYVQLVDISFANQLNINASNMVCDKSKGVIKVSWNTLNTPKRFASGDALLTLSIKARRKCTASDFINLSSKSLKPEIYNAVFFKYELGVQFHNVEAHIEKNKMQLGQNFPNPVRENTTIPVFVNVDKSAALIFADASGKILLKKKIVLENGQNNIAFKLSEIREKQAVLFYSLIEYGVITETRKMIISNQ